MAVELSIGHLAMEFDLYFCRGHALDLKRLRREHRDDRRSWSGSQIVAINRRDEVPF
jgi:hypothetical protein